MYLNREHCPSLMLAVLMAQLLFRVRDTQPELVCTVCASTRRCCTCILYIVVTINNYALFQASTYARDLLVLKTCVFQSRLNEV